MDPMTLIDSSRKKTNFVRHLIRELDLAQAQARQVRIEAFVAGLSAETPYDVIVSRAVTDAAALTRLVMPLLRKGGALWLWKGPHIEDEIRALEALPEARQGILRTQVHAYQLPLVGTGRNLIGIDLKETGAD
jgi:16S rRNA (guanine527-N7)-methyltransferase